MPQVGWSCGVSVKTAGLMRGDSLLLLLGDLSARLAIGNGPISPRPYVLLALVARSLSQTRQGSAQGGTFGLGVLVAFSPPCLWTLPSSTLTSTASFAVRPGGSW